MTSPDRDYDDIVRRALHAIVDPIEPAGDGLARIRERAAQPWLRRQVSLLWAECMDLGWLIVTRCEPGVARARSGLAAGGRAAGKRLSALSSYLVALAAYLVALAAYLAALVAGALSALSRRWRTGVHRKSSASAEETGLRAHPGWARRVWAWLATPTPWARPALLVAGVTVVVAALALGMPGLRGSLISLVNGGGGTSASSSGGGQDGSSSVGGSPFNNSVGPGGVAPSGRGTQSQAGIGYTGSSRPVMGPSATCSPSPGAQPTPSPSATPSASPSSSPTGTASPTGGPTSSATSGTPAPAGSVSAVKATRLRSDGSGSGGGGGTASAAASTTVNVPCSSSPSPQPNPSGTSSPSPSTSPTPPTGITTPPTPTTPPPSTGAPSP